MFKEALGAIGGGAGGGGAAAAALGPVGWGLMAVSVIGSLFGGGDESESTSDSGGSDMIDYERLASVLQSQPIVLSIDGKAVQKITAVQRRQGKNARGFS